MRRLVLPAAMRRCVLPSYTLAHREECEQARSEFASTPIEAIEIQLRDT